MAWRQWSHSISKKIKNNILPFERFSLLNMVLSTLEKLKAGMVATGLWADAIIKPKKQDIIIRKVDLIDLFFEDTVFELFDDDLIR